MSADTSFFVRYRTRFRENWPRIWNSLKYYLVIILLLLVFLVVLFFNRIFINIHAGQEGVLWKRFAGGTVMDRVYEEGFHIVAPWNIMAIYEMRLQQEPHEFIALSKDGLPIKVELSIRYRPRADELPLLHRRIGPEYVERVVKQEVQAQVRFVLAQYTPEQIYTSEGYLLQIVTQGAMGKIAERHIMLDDLLIKRLTLPDMIREAIERKLVEHQLVQAYEFRVQREMREAERKRIEGEGIRDFQLAAMQGGAFDRYLRFRGIEATVELAKSPNSKVVVIGGSDGGLPLILNTADQGVSASDLLPRTAEDRDTGGEMKSEQDGSRRVDIPPRSSPLPPAPQLPEPHR